MVYFLSILLCSFERREVGVIIKNLDVHSGEVNMNLNEALLSKNKKSSDTYSTDMEQTIDSVAGKNPPRKQASLSKYSSMFPEKVGEFIALQAGVLY